MCCGRNSVTSSPVVARAASVQRVGDAVRQVRWRWRPIGTQVIDRESELLASALVVSDSEILFMSDADFKAWVDAGYPGTKTVVAV